MLKVAFFVILLGLTLRNVWSLDVCEDQPDGVRLAHPADCSRFIQCYRGQTEAIRFCPFGLHFNRYESICDFKFRAGCDFSYAMQLVGYDSANKVNCDACRAQCHGNGNGGGGALGPVRPSPGRPQSNPSKPCISEAPTPPLTTPCDTIPTRPPPPPPSPKPCTTTTTTYPTKTTPCATRPPTPTPPPKPTPPPPPPATTLCPSKPTPPPPPPPSTPCSSKSSTAAPPTAPTPCPTKPTQPLPPPPPPIPSKPCPPSGSEGGNGEGNGGGNVGGNGSGNGGGNGGGSEGGSDNPQKPPEITGPSGLTCADPGKCKNQRDGVLFADDTSNGFIVCQCQCETKMPCPAGLVFNERLQVCDWPQS